MSRSPVHVRPTETALLAGLAGSVLAGAMRVASRARSTVKPLHPRGQLWHGRIDRSGLNPGTGVRWLDEPGSDDVLVRSSRAAGLPGRWPDVEGLAIRVPDPSGGFADLLLATTGSGRITRFLLRPGRSSARRYTSLLPHRAPTGALLLAAFPQAAGRYALACAAVRRHWRPFATLTLTEASVPAGSDPPVRFDPVLYPLTDLPAYDWVAALREPAYAAARQRSWD